MLLRLLLSLSLCGSAWAQPLIKSITPERIPAGREAEVRLQVSGATDRQLILMPGGPYIRQSLPLRQHIHDLALHKGCGLLAAGEHGLLVASVAAPGGLKIAGSFSTLGRVTRVVAEDDRAWLVNDANEVVALDITNPLKPVLLGRYQAGQAITDIAVRDGYIYLLLGNTVVSLLDMREPRAPIELSRHVLAEAAQQLSIDGDHLYAAQPGFGLTVIDVSDKKHPVQVARWPVTGGATAVTVQDSIALIARGRNGVAVFDVADPAHPKWMGSHSRLGRVGGIAASARRTVLWNDRDEIISLDVARPSLPSIAASLRGVATIAAGWLDANTVLAVTPSGLQLIDFSANPPLFSNENLDTGQGVNFGGERRLFIDGDIAYVADWFSGLHLYDIREPSHPRLLSSFKTPGSAKGVVVRDGIAFVADDDHGLQVLDVRDPLHTAQLASLPTRGLAYTPKLAGSLLYLASHRGGFQIIDISDVRAPRIVADVDTPGKAWSLEVAGGTLLVADDSAGLLVFDVSDAAHPRQVGSFSGGGAVEDVVVRGMIAYVASFDRGFFVLDVSIPSDPRQLGYVFTPGNARAIALKDGLAYVADWFSGVQVIDIRDPAKPDIIGEYDTSGAAWGIAIRGDHAYIGDWWGGFLTLDIRDPARPQLTDRFQARGRVMQIAVQDKLAYVAMERGGVQIFDITNPLNPMWISGVEIDGAINGLLAEGTSLHIAVGSGADSGLVSVDVGNPFQPRRVKHYAIADGVQRVAIGAAGRLYFSNSHNLGAIGPVHALPLVNHATRINDMWLAGERIYLATDQGMEVLDKQLQPLLRYKTAHPASLVRTRGDAVFLYGAEPGLQVLEASGDEIHPVSVFAPGEVLSDIALAGEVLFATGLDANLLEIDIADLRHLKLRNIYPLSHLAAGVAISGDTVLLAGNDIITAVKQLPQVAVMRRAKNDIRLVLPKELPAGVYSVVSVAPDGRRGMSRNMLDIEPPRLSKPKITPEEFQRLLREQRRENAGKPTAP